MSAPIRPTLTAQSGPIDPLRTRPDYNFRCDRCRAPHNIDTSIPSVIWNQIVERDSPQGDKYGALCTLCIDDLMVERGLTGEAEFYFNGGALRSKSYAPPTQGDIEQANRPTLTDEELARLDEAAEVTADTEVSIAGTWRPIYLRAFYDAIFNAGIHRGLQRAAEIARAESEGVHEKRCVCACCIQSRLIATAIDREREGGGDGK